MTTALSAADATAPPLPDHFSYSAMSTFHDCPRKWAYRYRHKAKPEFVPSSLVFGGAVHAALDHVHQAWLAGRPVTAADAMESYDVHWHADSAAAEVRFGKDDDDVGMRRQAAGLLALYMARHAETGRILAVEEPVSLLVDGMPVPAEGRVDLVIETIDSVTIVDAKTGRAAFTADRAAQAAAQLALYADALLPLVRGIGKPLNGRFVVLRRLKKPKIGVVDVSLTDADANRVRRALAETWSLIESARAAGAFPARPSWQCRMCPFQARCTADTGRAGDGSLGIGFGRFSTRALEQPLSP